MKWKNDKLEGYVNAYYRSIPCYGKQMANELVEGYNEIDLIGQNKLYDILLDLNLWWDIQVLKLEVLPIWMEVDE